MTVDIWEAMGTVVSLRIPDNLSDTRSSAIDGVKRVVDALEREYSLYMPDSPVSQLARGEVTLESLSDEFRDTYARAIEWRNTTAGAFTPHRTDGVIDLSGIVKADAIAAGAAVLGAHGITEFSLNFGGDIVVAGAGRTWPVAIGHPLDPSAVLATVELNESWCAIATSGTGDRGEHIWRSVTDDPVVGATVISSDIVESDVWATAIISGGHDAASSASSHGLAVLFVDEELQIYANDAMRNLIVEPTEQLESANAR